MTPIRYWHNLAIALALVGLTGCLSGVQTISQLDAKAYQTKATFTSADSTFSCSLVDTPEGSAILAWGKGWDKYELVRFSWRDAKGTHYVWWAEGIGLDFMARDYVLQPSEEQVAVHTYLAGQYSVVKSGEVKKIVGHISAASPIICTRQQKTSD